MQRQQRQRPAAGQRGIARAAHVTARRRARGETAPCQGGCGDRPPRTCARATAASHGHVARRGGCGVGRGAGELTRAWPVGADRHGGARGTGTAPPPRPAHPSVQPPAQDGGGRAPWVGGRARPRLRAPVQESLFGGGAANWAQRNARGREGRGRGAAYVERTEPRSRARAATSSFPPGTALPRHPAGGSRADERDGAGRCSPPAPALRPLATCPRSPPAAAARAAASRWHTARSGQPGNGVGAGGGIAHAGMQGSTINAQGHA